MSIDLNNASYNNLISTKVIAILQMNLTFHDDGPEGVLKYTKARDAAGLDIKYTVVEGPHAKRTFFGYLLIQGEKDGQKQMVDRNKGLLRAIVESAHYLDPSDNSAETCEKRKPELRDLDGLRFLGEIGIEKGKDGFDDKNVITRAITRDMPQWGNRPPIEQIAAGGKGGSTGGGGAPPPPSAPPKPPWAD
jgi:hypothetical protein